MESASPKTPKTTSWTYLWCFCEKNRTADLFSGIWPLRRDLERPLWVKMTSNLIFKARNGISIPENPKNDYLNISEMFSEGIIGKLVQKFVQKTVEMRKSKNRNYKKNCTLEWKMTVGSVIRDPPWVQIRCNTFCNFLKVFFVDLCYNQIDN